MLFRSQKLLSWKISARRKPLILRGARQVGKTYILQKFGNIEYDNVFYCNFEEDPSFEDFFSNKLEPYSLIKSLSLYFNREINAEKDLIIFDEIQYSNNALNALKYFNEKANQFHIVAAGSLIGLMLSGPRSFPVGKVNILDMYPMSFLEFLEAAGKPNLIKLIESTEEFIPYPLPFHNELIQYLKKYFFVGGMPEAVQDFVQNDNMKNVRDIQKEILNSYHLSFGF